MTDTGWSWMGKYVLGIIAALVLGVILGSLTLFKSAALGMPNLTAATLVQFLAHATALLTFALLSRRLAVKLRAGGQQLAAVADIIIALMTLVLLAVGYVVLTKFIDPFTARDVKQVVNWIFIISIVSAATWLGWALFNGGDALMAALKQAFTGHPESKQAGPESNG